jgi:hypothetical protein
MIGLIYKMIANVSTINWKFKILKSCGGRVFLLLVYNIFWVAGRMFICKYNIGCLIKTQSYSFLACLNMFIRGIILTPFCGSKIKETSQSITLNIFN